MCVDSQTYDYLYLTTRKSTEVSLQGLLIVYYRCHSLRWVWEWQQMSHWSRKLWPGESICKVYTLSRNRLYNPGTRERGFKARSYCNSGREGHFVRNLRPVGQDHFSLQVLDKLDWMAHCCKVEDLDIRIPESPSIWTQHFWFWRRTQEVDGKIRVGCLRRFTGIQDIIERSKSVWRFNLKAATGNDPLRFSSRRLHVVVGKRRGNIMLESIVEEGKKDDGGRMGASGRHREAASQWPREC